MTGEFTTLDPKSKIFKSIEVEKPKWWGLLCKDKDLYINIRKDNYINVYYLGGSIARIKYKADFVSEIHHKYLGIKSSSSKIYSSINLETLDEKELASIKCNIEGTLRDSKKEHPSEKRIQGEMIIKNDNYIDSEIQYNKDEKKLRIDLVELKDGLLTFIELKGISDPRLRNDEKRNGKKPEIIDQMETYQSFISKYEDELHDYYKNLIQIKQNLGLMPSGSIVFKINPEPKLIIVDTYKKVTTRRINRVKAIEELLTTEGVVYSIKEYAML